MLFARKTQRLILSLGLLAIIYLGFSTPVRVQAASLPTISSFVDALKNGQAGELRGMYIPGVLAFRIMEQPPGNPEFISPIANSATNFHMATEYGNIGILAHNYLSGASFFSLQKYQMIYLIYGDGSIKTYVVTDILRFQAYAPESPDSTFRNLDTNAEYSAQNLFNQMYAGAHHLTLQTCIASATDLSWGRLFIIAKPSPVYFKMVDHPQ